MVCFTHQVKNCFNGDAMETKQIQFEIWNRRPEVTMASIARRVGVSTQAVQQTVTRKLRSVRIAQAIAEAIEQPFEDVFPELAACPDRRRSACN
jgi:DNA-binding XRE family transcriptional regulator